MKTSVKSDSPDPAQRPAAGGAGADVAALSQASAFAASVTSSPREQDLIAQNLVGFPPEVSVRGVFYLGLAEVIARAKGPSVLADLERKAEVPAHVVAFRQYPHRNWYRFYYVAAHAMHPGVPLPTAMRLVARGFFRIFRESLLGKTMAALMGTEPRTLMPLLPKAYNLTVVGNHHAVEVVGERAVVWRARAEAVAWYEETFAGIIEGTAPSGDASASWWHRPPESGPMAVKAISKTIDGGFADYVFQITW
jgi:uncharacterized protein (TIGR02265 family)